MPKLRVHGFTLSLDGYGAGPNQDLENPLGVGGRALHEWAFATHTFRQMHGADGGSTGIDDEFAARGFDNIGAWILGRNTFGPVRGPWDGGATIRHTTLLSSCSLTTHGHRSP
jgi:dihydrofolate reductase